MPLTTTYVGTDQNSVVDHAGMHNATNVQVNQNTSDLTGKEAAGVAAALVDDLSGVTNAVVARTNLGLGGAAVLSVGSTTGTVAAGDDSRMTNARTPTAHAATHLDNGTDPVATFTSARTGVVPASGGGTANFLRADGTFAAPPGGAVPEYVALRAVFPLVRVR